MAEQHLATAAALARTHADLILEGRVHLAGAALARAGNNEGEQFASLHRAVACFAGCGASYLEAQALAGLARVHETGHDTVAARDAWAEVDRLYDEMNLPPEDQTDRPRPAE